MRLCEFANCGRKAKAKGLCKAHYNQRAKGRDLTPLGPTGLKPTAETREQFFWDRVEKTSGCWAWTGKKQTLGYGQVKFQGLVTYAYRYSYELAYGPIPEGGVIDHLCHNPNCVNPEHLRVASHGQNMQNLRGTQVNSKSGVRNVYWDAAKERWAVHVQANGKKYASKRFRTLEEAAVFAAEMRRKYHS